MKKSSRAMKLFCSAPRKPSSNSGSDWYNSNAAACSLFAKASVKTFSGRSVNTSCCLVCGKHSMWSRNCPKLVNSILNLSDRVCPPTRRSLGHCLFRQPILLSTTLTHRTNSSVPPSSGTTIQESEKSPEFPPNVSVKLLETESEALSSPPVENNALRHGDASSGHSDTSSSNSPVPPARPSLRQATRFALSSIPGGAYVVMQQQHLITRLISSRFRAWQSLRGRTKKTDAVVPLPTQVPTQGRRGRRSSKRKKKGRPLPPRPPAADSTLIPSPVEAVHEVVKGSASIEPFLKYASIEETQKVVAVEPILCQPNTVEIIERGEESTGFLNEPLPVDDLPADLQQSLELSLGMEESPQKLESLSTDFSRPVDASFSSPSSSVAETAKEELELDRSELLRNYEAVLQVVLASGVVEADAKRFLDEYRRRCNIIVTKHVEALQRY